MIRTWNQNLDKEKKGNSADVTSWDLKRTDMNDVSFIVDPEKRRKEKSEWVKVSSRNEHDVSIVTILDLKHEEGDGIRGHTHHEVSTGLIIEGERDLASVHMKGKETTFWNLIESSFP